MTLKEGQYCMKAQDGLKLLLPNSVQLVFTSPPFNCGIDYDVWDDEMELSQYVEMMVEVFREVYEVLVDGGRCVVDIPPVIKMSGGLPKNDDRVNMHNLFYTILERIGFKFRDVLFWLKGRERLEEATRFSSTNWGTWCSPKNPSPRSFTEILLVFCKGQYDLPDLEGGGTDLAKEEFPVFTNSVWLLPGRTDKRHPACFSDELASRVIKLYSWKGNLVLDPFAGIGTTLVAARRLGRRYLGFDVSEDYCDIANGQLDQRLITGY